MEKVPGCVGDALEDLPEEGLGEQVQDASAVQGRLAWLGSLSPVKDGGA